MGNSENFIAIAPNVKLGEGVKIFRFVNLYGCEIGDETKIGTFVEIQKGAAIGQRCKISSHTFICEGVTIEDEVFVGHGVMFTNDLYPRATMDENLQSEADWVVIPTRVQRGASIGSGVVVVAGVTIGKYALVAAGSTVTRDVPPHALVVGKPARQRGWVCFCGYKLQLEDAVYICPKCQRRFQKLGNQISWVEDKNI